MSCPWKAPDRKLKSYVYSKILHHHRTGGKSSTCSWLWQKHCKKMDIRGFNGRRVVPQAFHSTGLWRQLYYGCVLKMWFKKYLPYLPLKTHVSSQCYCSSLVRPTDFILQRNLICCQTCSFVQKTLFRFSLLSFLFSLWFPRLWRLAQCSWALGHLPKPCPFTFQRVAWPLPGVCTQDFIWKSPDQKERKKERKSLDKCVENNHA